MASDLIQWKGKSFQKLVAIKVSSDFANATQIVSTTLPAGSLKPRQVIVRVIYVGINASDINFTAGKYIPGIKPPFDTGFEALGQVVAAGSDATSLLGKYVALTQYGTFAEYVVAKSTTVFPLPSSDPSFLPLLVSGLTASIALEEVGEIKAGETVLVTAAAGGTGQFAVQLAKAKGCHVIGTCSSADKQAFLTSIGCDRAINYKSENLMSVLKTEYPKGIDVVYESVGGEFFDICCKNIAVKGRIIIIGMISGYKDGSAWKGNNKSSASLSARLLGQSASIRGFFLNHYTAQWKNHLITLSTLVAQKKIKSVVDIFSDDKYSGLNQIVHAVDYMYSGKNKGKVVVQIATDNKLNARL